MKIFTNSDFVGLMGMCEMECAIAVIVNKAKRVGCYVEHVHFADSEFDSANYERDGLAELIGHGWLLAVDDHEYKVTPELLRRIQQRVPNA